jgi:hypothetical protein
MLVRKLQDSFAYGCVGRNLDNWDEPQIDEGELNVCRLRAV